MNLGWQHRSDTAGEDIRTGFYQSREFASPEVVRRHLGRALPNHELQSIDVANVWHVPGKRLDIVYRIATPSNREDVVTVQFCRPGESRAAFADARRDCADHDALLHLPDWDAIAWTFPNDRRLPQLRCMLDPEQLRRIGGDPTGTFPGGSFSWKLLSYLPGRRCALHYRWGGASGGLVGKIGEDARASHRRLTRIWHDTGRSFSMPEPVATCSRIGARWERFVEGDRFDVAFSGDASDEAEAAVATALVDFHSTRIDGLVDRGADRVLARLERKVVPRIATALPGLSPRADALVARLAHGIERLSRRPRHTIHGDLHTANLLMRGGQVTFIDLDDLACGDAAYDLALLGSRLLLARLAGGISVDDLGSIVAALPSRYEQHGGEPVPDDVYAWYMSALLVGRQIKTCIRHLAPGLPGLAERLMTLAEQTLAGGRYDGSLP